MDSIPRLETQRLNLRAIFPNDAKEILALLSDPQVTVYHELSPLENIRQAHEMIDRFTNWFQTDQAVRWAIICKSTNELIGTCCFDTFHPKYQSINVGYNLRSDHWGKGFTTEAVQAIISHAFSKGILGPVNRVQAITVPDNIASEKVLSKLGFEHEGRMRQFGFWKDKYHDMNIFSLLRNSWASNTAT